MFNSTSLINNVYLTAFVACAVLAAATTPAITQLGFALATA